MAGIRFKSRLRKGRQVAAAKHAEIKAVHDTNDSALQETFRWN